jgi:ribonuclease G
MNLPSGSVAMIKANPSVAELLTDEERLGIEEIEQAFGIKLIIKDDYKLHQENFEIMTL